MAVVKTHKNVNIYVHSTGEFYANLVDNTDLYKDKTVNSDKIASIEKAIDKFLEENPTGKAIGHVYYYNGNLHKLDYTAKLGNRFIFKDKSSSVLGYYNQHTSFLLPSVEEEEEFVKFHEMNKIKKELQNKISDINKEINEINYKEKVIVANLLKKHKA